MVDIKSVVENPAKVAEQLYNILMYDREERLLTIDDYIHGNHPEPYMPDNADAEYRMLARRAVTNQMPLLINAPAQVLSVDGYRRGEREVHQDRKVAQRGDLPEWDHWESSRLQSRQDAIHRAALGYGHSFTLTEKVSGKYGQRVMTRGLSPLRTAALFEDPANDDNPYAAFHVQEWPRGTKEKRTDGLAYLWDRTYRYEIVFDVQSKKTFFRVVDRVRHGVKDDCPVTRFAAAVDLDGRTIGVVEAYFPIQDRINQTVFDLLVAQTGASFRTRWVTGMAPPLKMVYPRDEEGNIDYSMEPVPEIGPDGQPIPLPINMNAKKILFAEDSDAKFGDLNATPLDPYITALEQALKDLASVTQTPPHYMLGQIANLSADAMRAAESALTRKANNFKLVFGESWERVFRLALELLDEEGFDNMHGEIIWRDLETQSISQAADAYGKMAEMLDIPKRALWPMLPGVTQNELAEWELLAEQDGEIGTMQVDPASVADRVSAEAMSDMEDVYGDSEGPPGGESSL